MEDLKKIVNKIIEWFNNPRYRALVIMGLYVVFFAFVITMLRTSYNFSNNTPITKTAIEKYNTLTSYNYDASIYMGNGFLLKGFIGSSDYIIYDNTMFTLRDDKLYMTKEEAPVVLDENPFMFDIWKITPQAICSLIKDIEVNYKTEYSDGTVLKNYLVSIESFKKVYGSDAENIASGNISISIYELDNEIVKVELDLSNYYSVDDAIVVINYIK